MSQDDDAATAVFVFREQQPSSLGPDAEDREQTGGCAHALQPLGLATSNVRAPLERRRECLECPRPVTKVAKVGNREGIGRVIAAAGGHFHETVRVAERQRTQNDRVHQREHGEVGAHRT